ncbi:hypothetical protein L3V79_08805 [Thiotrichales bacterium 19S9-12]|nr:hypothetical protein [Thiotrichales bacterium 19S9-11]MCF6812455.1 hypothetical protein [Thiotrichales bacterium 19S9-12]
MSYEQQIKQIEKQLLDEKKRMFNGQVQAHQEDIQAFQQLIQEKLDELNTIKNTLLASKPSNDDEVKDKEGEIQHINNTIQDYSQFVVKEKSSEQTSDQQALLNSISNIAAILKLRGLSGYEVSNITSLDDGNSVSYEITKKEVQLNTKIVERADDNSLKMTISAPENLTSNEQQDSHHSATVDLAKALVSKERGRQVESFTFESPLKNQSPSDIETIVNFLEISNNNNCSKFSQNNNNLQMTVTLSPHKEMEAEVADSINQYHDVVRNFEDLLNLAKTSTKKQTIHFEKNGNTKRTVNSIADVISAAQEPGMQKQTIHFEKDDNTKRTVNSIADVISAAKIIGDNRSLSLKPTPQPVYEDHKMRSNQPATGLNIDDVFKPQGGPTR